MSTKTSLTKQYEEDLEDEELNAPSEDLEEEEDEKQDEPEEDGERPAKRVKRTSPFNDLKAKPAAIDRDLPEIALPPSKPCGPGVLRHLAATSGVAFFAPSRLSPLLSNTIGAIVANLTEASASFVVADGSKRTTIQPRHVLAAIAARE